MLWVIVGKFWLELSDRVIISVRETFSFLFIVKHGLQVEGLVVVRAISLINFKAVPYILSLYEVDMLSAGYSFKISNIHPRMVDKWRSHTVSTD